MANDRFSRTSVRTDSYSTAPTQQSRLVENAVPTVSTGQTGLEGLSSVFQNFFGQASRGLQAVAEAEAISQKGGLERDFQQKKYNLEVENNKQQHQATADAEAGRALDVSLADDRDYLETFQKVKGEKDGRKLASDWYEQVASKAGPNDDLRAATDKWLQEQWGTGTGEAIYDATALSTFKRFADGQMLNHSENQVKARIAQNVRDVDGIVFDRAQSGDLTPESIAEMQDMYRKADPWNASQAPLRVAQTIANAAKGDAGRAQAIEAALSRPGTGPNGKSYFDTPEGRQVQLSLGSTWNDHLSINAQKEISEISERVITSKTLDEAVQLQVDIAQARGRLGESPHYLRLLQSSQEKMDHLVRAMAGANQIANMRLGRTVVDQSVVNKSLLDALTKEGIDPIQNPEKTAVYVSQIGLISDELKTTYSRMLVNDKDTVGQQRAFQFFRMIQSRFGDDPKQAERMMTDDVKDLYRQMSDMAANGTTPIDQVINTVNEHRSIVGDVPSWAKLTGKKDDKTAEEEVNKLIEKSLKGSANPFANRGQYESPGPFNDATITIPPDVLDRIRNRAQLSVAQRGREGFKDWEKVLDGAARDITGGLELVPGAQGQLMLRERTLAQIDPRTGKSLIPMSPNAYNPETKQFENTFETYVKDVQAANNALPGYVGDPQQITVDAWQGREFGVYLLKGPAGLIHIPVGRDFTMHSEAGEKVVVTAEKDFKAFGKQLDEILNKGDQNGRFYIIPDKGGLGYNLGYRPGFTGKGRSVIEMEQQWQQGSGPASVKAAAEAGNTYADRLAQLGEGDGDLATMNVKLQQAIIKAQSQKEKGK